MRKYWFAGGVAVLFVAVMAFIAGRASMENEAHQWVRDNNEITAMLRANAAAGNVLRASMTLRMLERGDSPQAITFNCRMASSALKNLRFYDPLSPDGGKSNERIARQAEEQLARLRTTGACPPPDAPVHLPRPPAAG